MELLLETIRPFLLGSSPLLAYTLKIVEVLGAYRLKFITRYFFILYG